MQRKATKNTRAANAQEKKFHSWIKNQPCCVCSNPAPSIMHHCEGATFKHNKVLVGHWFCIPLCQTCDDVVTHGSRKAFREKFGPQSELWRRVANSYEKENKITPKRPCGGGSIADSIIPFDVYYSILDWGR